jgi:hypothetical protein
LRLPSCAHLSHSNTAKIFGVPSIARDANLPTPRKASRLRLDHHQMEPLPTGGRGLYVSLEPCPYLSPYVLKQGRRKTTIGDGIELGGGRRDFLRTTFLVHGVEEVARSNRVAPIRINGRGYILQNRRTSHYYVGVSAREAERLIEHNRGKARSTKGGQLVRPPEMRRSKQWSGKCGMLCHLGRDTQPGKGRPALQRGLRFKVGQPLPHSTHHGRVVRNWRLLPSS